MVVLKRPRINKPIPQDTPTQDVSGVVNKPISQPTKQDYSDILAGKKTEPASFDTKLEDWKKTYIPEATGPGQVTPTQISPDIAKIPIDNSVSGIYKTTIGNKLEDINQAKITASKNIAENIYKGAFKGGEMFNQATEKARTGDLKGAYADLGKAWIKEGSTVAEGIFSPISVGLSKEVTSEFGPTGETISEIAPLPFKALHKINYDLSKQYLGLDDETANNYSTVISTLFLLGIGTKGKDPGMEIQKSFDLVKGGKATIESEKIYSQLIRQVHPDYFQKADPVYKQKIENIASELNVLRESGDIAGMQKIIDQNKGIIEEARKSQKQNIMKGGYIDLGVILGKDKNKIELAKNEDLTKIVEILNDGAKNFNPEILGAGLIELRDLNIDQESKDKIIEETARMKSIIESYKESISTPGKEKSLIGKYGEDLYNKARNVILNDKGQDRFTDIEGNKKPNKINKDGSKGDDLEKLYLAIEEYKTQNNIDNGVTSQDLYEELKSAINKKSLVRPTKKSVLGELDNTGNLNIENIDNTGLDKIFSKPNLSPTLEEKNKNITPVTLNEPKIDYENLTDKQSKELLFSEKEISQIDQSLGKINDIQKLKAQTGKKDTIKFHPKYDEIKNLVKNGVMEFRGMDKDKPHLMKFQYTKLAKEYFGIGEDKIREYNKIGVHYPKDLYSQIKNKLKQEKGKTFIQRNKVNIAKKKEIQIKTGEKTKEKDINEITKEGIKIKQNNVFTRTQKKVGEKLVNESRRANVDDVTNLIREKGDKILEKGVEYAENSGMITEAEATQLRDNIKLAKENKESPITIKGDLSPTQRLSLMDLLGWDKVLKKITEQKIIIPQLRRSLKELGARLYIVGSPEGNRVKIPFSLMGNKSNTYRNVILPMIKKGALQGAKTYIEPYGGAGTSYFFADDIINSGIKDIHINHFDNEKYEVINAIKNKTIQSISGEITSAYNSIIEEIGKVMQDIPEVKSLMEKFDIKPGTSGFKIIAETYFYPQYAPDFFKERPDTKLAIRGEITESFKDWLTEKIKTEAEDQGLKLEGKDLENRVDDILNDTSLFETNYPEISKKISSVIDRFDVMDFEKGDYKTAITTSLARHFRNRGDSGQKVVSATNGFQNMIGIRDKMISGLETYQETFNKHGDKIKIYNMDGKDFIKRMGKDYNNKQSIIYLDPPYIRTTQTYIKNVTDEILKNSLDDYANTDKIDQLFNPMKDSMMMFTNDVNGKYFEALNKMLGDRMSKDILAYKEGTTPTSFITTTELSIKPRDLGLRDYDILRNKRTKEIQKALEENYLPKIAEQQKKVWAKVEQEFMKTMKEKFGDLENIQNEQFKASEALEKLEESISQAITGRDKQRIIYEARAWLKSNKVRGSEVYKIIQKIEGFIKRKSEMINGIRILKNKLLNSNTIASEIKPEIQEYINAEALEFKRITGKIVDEASIIDMINKGEISISDDNKDIYDKYINDDNYSVQIDNAIGKQSIYNMDIQQLESIVNKLKYFEEIGREILENRKKGQEIELAPLISEAIESSIKLDITEISLDRDINELTRTGKNMFKFRKLWNEFKKTVKGGMLEITPSVFIFENELGINKQVYTIYKKAFTEWVEYHSKAVEGFGKLKKELGLKKDDFNKIGLYGLANRGDGKGVIKIYSLIYNTGKNPITEKAVDIKDQEAILDIIKGFKEDSFLNESQHKMLKYMRGIFDEIGKRINLTSLETENIMMDVMKDYFPIKLDIEKNLDMETDPEIGKVLENGFKTKNIEHGFIKKATGKSVVPTIDAKLVFLSHVYKASYYAYMQKPLYQLSDLMNALGQEKIGSVGMKYFKNWIDMMAKQGKYSTKGALDRTVGNLSKLGSKSVIAFNPGSYLIQPIALLESKLVGGEISKIGTAWTNKDFKETIKKSKILPARDFRHMFGSDNILKDKANETIDIGLIPISKIDKFSASGIFYNLYHEFKKLGFKEEDCIYYADIGMEKTMANPMFDGKSLAQLKNERGVGSLFTSFMTFGANAFANRYIYGGGLSRVIKEKSKKGTTIPKQLVGKNRIKGILYGALVVGVLSFLYQQIIQELNKKMFNQKDYPETLTVKIISQIAQEIPLLGQLVGQNKYGSFLGLKGVNDILKSIAGIYNGKEDQTKTNNAYKLLFSVMQMGGFPAVVQKIWKGYFMTPSGKTGSSKSTPGKINRPKLKRPSLKMNKIRRPT